MDNNEEKNPVEEPRSTGLIQPVEIDHEMRTAYTPNVAVKSDITLGISDSLGFGGHDACVAFRRYEE